MFDKGGPPKRRGVFFYARKFWFDRKFFVPCPQVQTLSTMQNTHSTKGRDLAWDIFVGLRSNQFKDMTLEEIDDFRTVAASFLNLKKED